MLVRIKFSAAILLSLVLALLLYHFTFNYYFFQDDYFNFNITNIKGIGDFLSFFKFRDDIIAYRPISLQIYFYLMHQLFGFNATAFRLINFSFLALTFLTILIVAPKIIKSKKTALLAGFFWVTSSIHFMNIAVINYNLIGTLFYLITFYFFLKYVEFGRKVYFISSLLFFLLTIGSFEFSVTLPIILAIYFLTIKHKPLLKIGWILSPFIILTVFYMLLRVIFIKTPSIIEYKIAFNFDSIKAFIWYGLWTFNVPEEFKKQIVGNIVGFNEFFLRDYWVLIFKTIMGVATIVFLGVVYPLYRHFKYKKFVKFELVVFLALFFIVTISPVLLLPNHNFMMYLTLPAISIYLLMAYLIQGVSHKFITISVAVVWLFLSTLTLNFYKNNSFTNESQKISRNFMLDMKYSFPSLPRSSVLYYYLPYQKDQQALLDQNAIQAIYKDTSLSIYYTKESLLEYIRTAHEIRPVFIFVPK